MADYSTKAIKNRTDRFEKLDPKPLVIHYPAPEYLSAGNMTLEQQIKRILQSSGIVSKPAPDEDFEDDNDELLDDLEQFMFDHELTEYEKVASEVTAPAASKATAGALDIQQPAPQSQGDKGSFKSDATQAFDLANQTNPHNVTKSNKSASDSEVAPASS